MPHKSLKAKQAYQSGYYQKHRAESNARKTRWREKNQNKVLLDNARKRAKEKGIEFSLELSDIHIPEVCPLLGIPLRSERGKGRGNASPGSPTLDRIDNSRGYVPDNVWVISWRANRIKCDASLDEMRIIVLSWEKKLNEPVPGT
jgi:hypothetical protein